MFGVGDSFEFCGYSIDDQFVDLPPFIDDLFLGLIWLGRVEFWGQAGVPFLGELAESVADAFQSFLVLADPQLRLGHVY